MSSYHVFCLWVCQEEKITSLTSHSHSSPRLPRSFIHLCLPNSTALLKWHKNPLSIIFFCVNCDNSVHNVCLGHSWGSLYLSSIYLSDLMKEDSRTPKGKGRVIPKEPVLYSPFVKLPLAINGSIFFHKCIQGDISHLQQREQGWGEAFRKLYKRVKVQPSPRPRPLPMIMSLLERFPKRPFMLCNLMLLERPFLLFWHHKAMPGTAFGMCTDSSVTELAAGCLELQIKPRSRSRLAFENKQLNKSSAYLLLNWCSTHRLWHTSQLFKMLAKPLVS